MNRLGGYAGVGLAVLMWGLSFQVGEDLAGHLSPWWLTLWRYTLAALVMSVVAYACQGRHAVPPRGLLPRIALMGLFGHTFFSLCFFLGMRDTPPSTAALVTGLEPAFAAMLAALFLRREVGASSWLGIITAFAGVALAAAPFSTGAHFSNSWSGPLWLLVSAASFAVYSLMGGDLARHLSPLALGAATMRWSLPPLWLGVIWLNGDEMLRPPAPSDVASISFLVLGVTVLAMLGWNWGLRQLGTQRTMIWANMIPVVGVLAAAATGHPVTTPQWLGLVLVVAGVAVVQRHGRLG
jgi:drug/metabolite transporter (DMT)-like permease